MAWTRVSAPAAGVAAVPRAGWPGAFIRTRAPDRVERAQERGVENGVPGRGWSSPVISGGRVWLTTATTVQKDTSLRLMAFDVETGKTALDVEVFKSRGTDLQNPKNSHASPTPILDGDRVYVHFGAQGTAALTTAGR